MLAGMFVDREEDVLEADVERITLLQRRAIKGRCPLAEKHGASIFPEQQRLCIASKTSHLAPAAEARKRLALRFEAPSGGGESRGQRSRGWRQLLKSLKNKESCVGGNWILQL